MLKQIWPFILLLFISCKSSSSSKAELSDYHHEYLIYVSSPDVATVKCEASFQKGGEFQKAALLPKGYEVFFDGQPVPSDNEEYPTYAIEKNVTELFGDHTWTVKQNGVTVIETPTSLAVFKLTNMPAESTIGSEDLVLTFEGAKDGDTIEWWFEDVNGGADNYRYPVKNNSITVAVTDIRKAPKGPHSFGLSLLKTTPVNYNGEKVGIAETNYMLQTIPVLVNY